MLTSILLPTTYKGHATLQEIKAMPDFFHTTAVSCTRKIRQEFHATNGNNDDKNKSKYS